MRLIVITPSRTQENEHFATLQMLKMGLPVLHVRKPGYSTVQMKKYLEGFPKEYHNRMVLHTHHRLLLDYNLLGIHQTKVHKKRRIRNWITKKLLEFKRSTYLRSTSANSISSMAQYYPLYDYVMLTPIFGETSEHRPAFSIGTLNAIIKKYPGKLIARGGTDADSIAKAQEMGFEGIAFQNYIWKNGDPVGQFKNLMTRFDELGIKVY